MKTKRLSVRFKIFLKLASRRGPLRVAKRLVISLPNTLKRLGIIFYWSTKKTEDSNFYYEITDRNKRHLIEFLALVLGQERRTIAGYILEAESCETLRRISQEYSRTHQEVRDSELYFGRRLGWYVVTRATKPELVLETGVHQGLGALAICCALEKNGEEGSPGRYIGTDNDERAGAFIKEFRFDFATILYGDSISSINSLYEEVDLYISDSDHTPNYESKELIAVSKKMKPTTVIISDNAHATDVLMDWSIDNNRNFAFFREDAKDHWYPGAGIGISWN